MGFAFKQVVLMEEKFTCIPQNHAQTKSANKY